MLTIFAARRGISAHASPSTSRGRSRELVDIERVPIEGEAREAGGATEADIGEDEVVVQVFEEEVVVSKKIVLKEEIRIRKRVVEVEVNLRKEEVEIRRPDKVRRRRCPVGAPNSGTPSAGGGLSRWAAWATSS